MLDWSSLLKQLRVDDRDIVFGYMVVYSRFEYSLKRSGYVRRDGNSVSANWERYIKDIERTFGTESSTQVKEAIDYLLNHPPQSQVLSDQQQLTFQSHSSTLNGSIPLRLYHCARIVRNNLFHGGKYPSNPVSDVARDRMLLLHCHTVLEHFLYCNQELGSFFYECS